MTLLKGKLATGLLVAAVSVFMVGAVGTASAQLVNGGFEFPDASGGDIYCSQDWGCFGDVFTTASIGLASSQSLKIFGPFGAAGGGAGATQLVAAAPGQTWVGEISAYHMSTDPIQSSDFAVYKIEFLDAAFNFVAGGLFGVDVFESNQINAGTATDTWTLLGVGTAPAPAGTAWARAVIVKVTLDDGGNPGAIFFDHASLFIDDPIPVQGTTFGQIKQMYR